MLPFCQTADTKGKTWFHSGDFSELGQVADAVLLVLADTSHRRAEIIMTR